jgi:hypothetical protein
MSSPASPTPLQRFVDDELLRAPLLFDQVLDGTLDALRKDIGMAAPGARAVLADLLQAARARRDDLAEYFGRSLRQQMQQELQRLNTTVHGALMAGPATRAALSLVDEDEVSIDVELARTLQIVRDAAEYELHELRTFISALAGDMHVSGDTNPVRPEVYAQAWWAAAQALPLSRSHQIAFLHHGANALGQALRLAYAGACSRLEELGVEPAAYRTLVLPAGSRRGGRGVYTTFSPDLHGMRERMIGVTQHSPTGSLRPDAPLPSLPPIPPAVDARAPAPVPPTAATRPAADDRAQGTTRGPSARAIEVRTIGDVRTVTPARAAPRPSAPTPAAPPPLPWREVAKSARTPRDRQSVELVSRLFDGIIADDRVPPDLQALLERLHSTALRLTLRDPGMVDDEKHPLWTFVNRLAHEAEMAPDAGDPERARLLKLAQATIDQLAAEPDPHPGLFRWAGEHLDNFLQQRLARRLSRLASQVGALQKLEDRLAAGAVGTSTLGGAFDTPQLDTVPSELMGTPTGHAPLSGERSDGIEPWLAALQPGHWVRMFIQGRWVRAQLLWPGERREFWLFGDGASDTSWAVRRRALVAMRENGLVKTLRQRSLLRSAAALLQQQLQRAVGG